ncbi:MAG: hypothetical protein V3Q69_00565 [Burkholderia sp.]|nr:MAG: hypothetical protein E5299_00775 [Burkholderia gladioli]
MALLHKSSVRTKGNELQTSLVRNPFVSPEIIPSMLLRPHTRFMQQRLVRHEKSGDVR